MLNSARASCALALSILAAPRPVPRELSTLAARASLSSEILAWCKGEFRARQRGGYAVAIRSVDTAGRYVVVEATGTIDELAPFADAPDLACYTAAGARELNATMQRSATISGRLTPRWRTTVVCGFTDATTAACWQYSPVEKRYVSVGGWTT